MISIKNALNGTKVRGDYQEGVWGKFGEEEESWELVIEGLAEGENKRESCKLFFFSIHSLLVIEYSFW